MVCCNTHHMTPLSPLVTERDLGAASSRQLMAADETGR